MESPPEGNAQRIKIVAQLLIQKYLGFNFIEINKNKRAAIKQLFYFT